MVVLGGQAAKGKAQKNLFFSLIKKSTFSLAQTPADRHPLRWDADRFEGW